MNSFAVLEKLAEQIAEQREKQRKKAAGKALHTLVLLYWQNKHAVAGEEQAASEKRGSGADPSNRVVSTASRLES